MGQAALFSWRVDGSDAGQTSSPDAASEAEWLRRNERLACLGLLAAGIVHEINNPLGSALVAAETALSLKDNPDGAVALEACLRNIVASLERCGRIVRTLLRYTRQAPSERQACNINDVAEEAVELARPYADAHGADLRLDLDPAAPLVPMNPLEIELVLVNLIRNAVEAGEGRVSVVVSTMRTEQGLRAIVRDDGRGMPPEQLARVFDPFYTTRRESGGSGLGLSLALSIVHAHNGRMEVQSEEGKGAAVILDLPAAAPTATSSRREHIHGRAPPRAPLGRSSSLPFDSFS